LIIFNEESFLIRCIQVILSTVATMTNIVLLKSNSDQPYSDAVMTVVVGALNLRRSDYSAHQPAVSWKTHTRETSVTTNYSYMKVKVKAQNLPICVRTAYVYCSITDQTFIIYMQTERKIFSSVKAFPSHLLFLLLLLLPADGPHCVHNTVRPPAAIAVIDAKPINCGGMRTLCYYFPVQYLKWNVWLVWNMKYEHTSFGHFHLYFESAIGFYSLGIFTEGNHT